MAQLKELNLIVVRLQPGAWGFTKELVLGDLKLDGEGWSKSEALIAAQDHFHWLPRCEVAIVGWPRERELVAKIALEGFWDGGGEDGVLEAEGRW